MFSGLWLGKIPISARHRGAFLIVAGTSIILLIQFLSEESMRIQGDRDGRTFCEFHTRASGYGPVDQASQSLMTRRTVSSIVSGIIRSENDSMST